MFVTLLCGFTAMMFLKKEHYSRISRLSKGIDCFSCGQGFDLSYEDLFNRYGSKKIILKRCISCNRNISLGSILSNKIPILDMVKSFCIRYTSSDSSLRTKKIMLISWIAFTVISLILLLFGFVLVSKIFSILINFLSSFHFGMEILSFYFIFKTYGKTSKSN
jgi:hypothetical protein